MSVCECVCVCVCDSLCCTAETNTVKQLFSKKKTEVVIVMESRDKCRCYKKKRENRVINIIIIPFLQPIK